MKTAFAALVILLAGLFLSGCSPESATSNRPADPANPAGSWDHGFVLQFAKRDGASLQDVQLTQTNPNGQTTVFTAASAVMVTGSKTNNADPDLLKIFLSHVRVERRSAATNTVSTTPKLMFTLHRLP